jgi:erythronate-4-phosphate dehydrogenase
MKIVCTTNIPFAEEAFSTLGSLQIIPAAKISNAILKDIDALITRSTLKVTGELLAGTKIKFVGTCTIGFDHIDTEYLEKNNIHWANAAGCNANSVAEYIVAGLLYLANKYSFTLQGRTISVIGAGNVGKKVIEKACALGLKVLKNDPPLSDATGDSSYKKLEEILPHSDIVTLHVPLTKEGKYPTFRMVNHDFYRLLKKECIFINAARGGIMISDLFIKARNSELIKYAITDTWEGEPNFRVDVLEKSHIATPHIAGHSFEGKVVGTYLIYKELCRFSGKTANWYYETLLPASSSPELYIDAYGKTFEQTLLEAVRAVYNIEVDDARMREIARENDPLKRASAFEKFRQNYPIRREFRFTNLHLKNASAELIGAFKALQFKVSPE